MLKNIGMFFGGIGFILYSLIEIPVSAVQRWWSHQFD